MRQSNFVRKIQPILIILCEWLWETSLPKFKIKIEVSQRFCYRSNNRIQSQFYLIRIWQFSIKQKLYINIVRFHANRSVDINALYTNNTNHQFHLLEHRAAKISTKSLEAVRRKQKLGRKKKYIIKSIWKPSVLSLSVSKSWFSFFFCFTPHWGLIHCTTPYVVITLPFQSIFTTGFDLFRHFVHYIGDLMPVLKLHINNRNIRFHTVNLCNGEQVNSFETKSKYSLINMMFGGTCFVWTGFD